MTHYHLAIVISASVYAVFILAPLDPGGPHSQGDELLRPDGLSIQAQRAEARRTTGGGEVLGEEAASPLPTS